MATYDSSLNFGIRIVFHVLCTLTLMASELVHITTTDSM